VLFKWKRRYHELETSKATFLIAEQYGHKWIAGKLMRDEKWYCRMCVHAPGGIFNTTDALKEHIERQHRNWVRDHGIA